MKSTTKKTAQAAPPAPAPDVPHVPQDDPLGLIPGVNDDPNVPPPDDPVEVAPPTTTDPVGDPPAGVVMTKDGRVRTVIRVDPTPAPPPEPRAGRAPRKSDLAAAYYHKLHPGCNFSALSLNDQALWYERAVNAGGSI